MGITKKKILKQAKYSLRFLPDKTFIQLYYFTRFHKFCNFVDPKTYNEKLQWLKINDRNPVYIDMVDKANAKVIAKKSLGKEAIVPTLGIWDSFDEINFEQLPKRFVLKCTHDSEGLVIVQNKEEMD